MITINDIKAEIKYFKKKYPELRKDKSLLLTGKNKSQLMGILIKLRKDYGEEGVSNINLAEYIDNYLLFVNDTLTKYLTKSDFIKVSNEIRNEIYDYIDEKIELRELNISDLEDDIDNRLNNLLLSYYKKSDVDLFFEELYKDFENDKIQIRKYIDTNDEKIYEKINKLEEQITSNKEGKKKGGKMTVQGIYDFIQSTYKKDIKSYKGYIRDDELSDNNTKVYHNNLTNKSVVVEKPTDSLRDVFSDFLVGIDLSNTLFKKIDSRFTNAFKIHKKVKDKYGSLKNAVLLGYSLGAIVAEKSPLAPEFAELILVNKPVSPGDVLHNVKPHPNQTEIRTDKDITSLLKGFQDSSVREKVIITDNLNPISAHQIKNFLPYLDPNEEIGDSSVITGASKKK